jgi:putative protease
LFLFSFFPFPIPENPISYHQAATKPSLSTSKNTQPAIITPVITFSADKGGAGKQMEGKKVGEITHYYSKISVGIIKLTDTLNVGDTIQIKGATTDFEQSVDEMQYDHENIESAEAGQ